MGTEASSRPAPPLTRAYEPWQPVGLELAAQRLARPRSAIVRDAIREYAARAGRLSEDERRRMLRAIDAVSGGPPTRPRAAVDRELLDLRRARRGGGRRSS